MLMYVSNTWNDGETIRASDLNRIEKGIEDANKLLYVMDPSDVSFTYTNLRQAMLLNRVALFVDSQNDGSSESVELYELKTCKYNGNRYYAIFEYVDVSVEGNPSAEAKYVVYSATDADDILVRER